MPGRATPRSRSVWPPALKARRSPPPETQRSPPPQAQGSPPPRPQRTPPPETQRSPPPGTQRSPPPETQRSPPPGIQRLARIGRRFSQHVPQRLSVAQLAWLVGTDGDELSLTFSGRVFPSPGPLMELFTKIVGAPCSDHDQYRRP